MRYVSIREALTRREKELKRDYLLSTQRGSDTIPSLLEVFAHHDESEYRDPAVFDSIWIETMDEQVPGWQDLSAQDLIEAVRPYREKILEQARHEAAEVRFGSTYRDAVEALASLPSRAYRAVLLPDAIDPARHDGLGTHWSLDRSAALPYGATRRGRIVVYEIELDPDSVNRRETVLARTDPD